MEPNVVYYRDSAREWRWRAVAANRRIIATSGEGYERLAGAINGFHALQEIIKRTPVFDVEEAASEDG